MRDALPGIGALVVLASLLAWAAGAPAEVWLLGYPLGGAIGFAGLRATSTGKVQP